MPKPKAQGHLLPVLVLVVCIVVGATFTHFVMRFLAPGLPDWTEPTIKFLIITGWLFPGFRLTIWRPVPRKRFLTGLAIVVPASLLLDRFDLRAVESLLIVATLVWVVWRELIHSLETQNSVKGA